MAQTKLKVTRYGVNEADCVDLYAEMKPWFRTQLRGKKIWPSPIRVMAVRVKEIICAGHPYPKIFVSAGFLRDLLAEGLQRGSRALRYEVWWPERGEQLFTRLRDKRFGTFDLQLDEERNDKQRYFIVR